MGDGEREEGTRSCGLLSVQLLRLKGGVSSIAGRAPGKRARWGARTGGWESCGSPADIASAPRTAAPGAAGGGGGHGRGGAGRGVRRTRIPGKNTRAESKYTERRKMDRARRGRLFQP